MIQPRKYWDKLLINWCTVSSINSSTFIGGFFFLKVSGIPDPKNEILLLVTIASWVGGRSKTYWFQKLGGLTSRVFVAFGYS